MNSLKLKYELARRRGWRYSFCKKTHQFRKKENKKSILYAFVDAHEIKR
jgi:hypothetical protein